MNAVVLYQERDSGIFQEDFPKLRGIFRFLTLYGFEYDFICNQLPKRGTHYDLGVVVSREEVRVKCGLYFRFERADEGIPAAIRLRLDEKYPAVRREFKLFGLAPEEAAALVGGIPCPADLSVTYLTEHRDTAVYARSENPASVEQFTLMLYQKAGEAVYSDRDESLESCALELLRLRKKRVCVSESLTGGLISDRIVRLPGASEVFFEGMVTYHNDSKAARLGVEERTLRNFGAVSEGTAYEMCRGLMATGKADYALSTTGIAGPGGGTNLKPVGTVFIGVANAENIVVFKHCFAGTREEVRQLSASYALWYLIRRIQNNLDYYTIVK